MSRRHTGMMLAALLGLAGGGDPRSRPRRTRTTPRRGMRKATRRPWCARERERRLRQLAKGMIRENTHLFQAKP